MAVSLRDMEVAGDSASVTLAGSMGGSCLHVSSQTESCRYRRHNGQVVNGGGGGDVSQQDVVAMSAPNPLLAFVRICLPLHPLSREERKNPSKSKKMTCGMVHAANVPTDWVRQEILSLGKRATHVSHMTARPPWRLATSSAARAVSTSSKQKRHLGPRPLQPQL